MADRCDGIACAGAIAPRATRLESGAFIVLIVAYPRRGIAYVEALYRAAGELGVEVVEGQWGGRWLLEHVKRGALIHIHWPSFLYYHSGEPLATFNDLLRFCGLLTLMRVRGVRMAWTAHNLYPHDGGQQCWAHRMARRFVTRTFDTIFVHGPTAASIVEAEFKVDPRKLEQVPHGHWRSIYPDIPERSEARGRIDLPQDALIYGFIGTCHPYKNLEALAQAFGRMESRSHLVIAGRFPSADYLARVRAAIPPQAVDRVHFVQRFLRDDEIMTFVSALDALVLPYRDILTSGAIMLGMSAGVPVIAPRMGGIADVVTDKCGLLYDPDSPEGLVEAMSELPRRVYSAQDIVAHALEFDWKTSARKLIDLAARSASGA
jgi:beta-1,4-mannosyltransferase